MGWSFTGGLSNTDVDTDANRNLKVTFGQLAILAANGGYYSVTGTSGAVAVSLAANTFLASMYVAQPSAVGKRVYVTRVRTVMYETTAAANTSLVPGALGIQKYVSPVAPTGGTARTINKFDEVLFPTSVVTDVRDSNAALTGTAPTFGNVPDMFLVPTFITVGAMWYENIYEPEYPLVLVPGEGLALRTQVVMPALQQWLYSYSFRWFEK